MRRGGEPQTIVQHGAARAKIEGPAVGARRVEPRLMKRERRADARAGHEPGPCGTQEKGINRHGRPARIRTVDRLRDVAQPNPSIDQAYLSDLTGWNPDRRENAGRIDRRRRLDRFDTEL